MRQVRPRQGQPHDQGETERGQRRPAQLNHGQSIVGSILHAPAVELAAGRADKFHRELRQESEPETSGSAGCLAATVWLCCVMMWRTHTSVTRRMGRMTRMLMLVLGVVSVPSIGLAAMQRPHCAQHVPSPGGQEAHSGDTHQAPEPAPVSWDTASEHVCPHCPATDCARIAPCTASSTAAISEASLTVSEPASDRVSVRKVRIQPYSATHQPPTPPPQLIS